ncbi:hypothetical protein H1C71_037797 [Ictidomys tridecemlineatus]|nr:hypothetical protein H1C71_037797 [Ictidomys tridecemlineatus]
MQSSQWEVPEAPFELYWKIFKIRSIPPVPRHLRISAQCLDLKDILIIPLLLQVSHIPPHGCKFSTIEPEVQMCPSAHFLASSQLFAWAASNKGNSSLSPIGIPSLDLPQHSLVCATSVTLVLLNLDPCQLGQDGNTFYELLNSCLHTATRPIADGICCNSPLDNQEILITFTL